MDTALGLTYKHFFYVNPNSSIVRVPSSTLTPTRQVCLSPMSVQAVYVVTPVVMFFSMYVSRYVVLASALVSAHASPHPVFRRVRQGNSLSASVASRLCKSRSTRKS